MRQRIVAGVSCSAVIIWYAGHWWGVPVAAVVAYGMDRILKRQVPAQVRARHERAEADLPLAADLLGAALCTGVPVDRGVAAVAEALGGPLGEDLGRVARALRLGADPPEAWSHLGDLPGATRMASTAVRSSISGAAFAGALTRLAGDLRADRAIAAEAAARRAGVLIMLPLGLCFLPAFMLAGLVPVVVAVLGDVL
jgi:Flp pilus assembly protein TadB